MKNQQNPNPLILVIEDDVFLTDAYQVKFTQSGFRIKMAKDGESGLEALVEEKPSIIILDLMLPKMDGFQVLERIKRTPEYKDIPVLIASNFSDPSHKQRSKELGADHFFVKSDISINDLIHQCRKLAV